MVAITVLESIHDGKDDGRSAVQTAISSGHWNGRYLDAEDLAGWGKYICRDMAA
jgi:hypothetical protein